MRVREATAGDLDWLSKTIRVLWKDEAEERIREVAGTLAGRPRSTLPMTMFVAELPGEAEPVGFIEVGLRSHAEDCDAIRPAGYLEQWWVATAHRRSGVGRALVAAAEDWARGQGCTEMASDTHHDNLISQEAHAALGYLVVERLIAFRKPLQK